MTRLNDRLLQNLSADDKPITDSVVAGLIAVPKNNGVNWILRFVSPVLMGKDGKGKRREMGLGVYPHVKLAEARDKAIDARKLIATGVDPIEAREAAKIEVIRTSNMPTFGEAATATWEKEKKGWKDTKNVKAWIASVRRLFEPILKRPVDTLKAKDFAACLSDAWHKHPNVAEDVLRRARAIMKWCAAGEFIDADPTALVRVLLGKRTHETEHNPAMSFKVIPAFMRENFADLDPLNVKACALFVLIHTACRSNEVRGMRWGELDLDAGVWTIPPERMKGKKGHKRQHIVPLVAEVVSLLQRMKEKQLHPHYVFPNATDTGPITDYPVNKLLAALKAPSQTEGRFAVPHGFRSTFKDWAVERATEFDYSTSERALAHTIRGQVQGAYERTTQFDARVKLMRKWADHLHAPANVVQLPAAA
jgi:integrase